MYTTASGAAPAVARYGNDSSFCHGSALLQLR